MVFQQNLLEKDIFHYQNVRCSHGPAGQFSLLESAPSLWVNVRLRLIQLNLLPFLINVNFVEKKSYLHKSNMIYIVKREGLYQNKANSSLNCNCKIGYYCFPFNFRCRCNVCLYYGLLLHVLNNQQKSD